MVSTGLFKRYTGNGAHIDLGIPINANVDVSKSHRRRHHRLPILNIVDIEIENYKAKWKNEEDISMWKNEKGCYKKKFTTKGTWHVIREKYFICHWYKAVWFKHATPKFSFILWTAMHERLSTCDRMKSWNINIDETCVLCQGSAETMRHLFFECSYSKKIWECLMKGVMRDQFSAEWERIVWIASDGLDWCRIRLFTLRYVFQATIHAIWRERNQRRHGETSSPSIVLVKKIDKTMRNKFTIARKKGDKELEGGMAAWFDTRQS